MNENSVSVREGELKQQMSEYDVTVLYRISAVKCTLYCIYQDNSQTSSTRKKGTMIKYTLKKLSNIHLFNII